VEKRRAKKQGEDEREENLRGATRGRSAMERGGDEEMGFHDGHIKEREVCGIGPGN